MFKKTYYNGTGLASIQFAPWYNGVFFSTMIFFFTYFIFYKLNFYFFILFFILLAAIISVTAFSVINALIFLIITYLLSAFVFFLAGLDFLGLMLIFIYVGAIAILFLFVVMTLTNEKITKFPNFNVFDGFIFGCFFIFLFFFLVFAIRADFYYDLFYKLFLINAKDLSSDVYYQFDPLIEIGLLLYGRSAYLFFMISLILFLGFFCPIVLTLEEDDNTRFPTNKSLKYPHWVVEKIVNTKYSNLDFFVAFGWFFIFVWGAFIILEFLFF